jgi:hypothetical protein
MSQLRQCDNGRHFMNDKHDEAEDDPDGLSMERQSCSICVGTSIGLRYVHSLDIVYTE